MDNFFKQVNPWLQMAGNAIGNVAKAGYGLDEKELGNLGGNIADAAHAGANGLGWVFKQPLASPQDDPNATNTNQSYNIDQYGSPMTHQLPTPQDMQVIAQNQAKTAQDLPAHPQTTESENPFQQLGDVIRNIAHPQAEASSAPANFTWPQNWKPANAALYEKYAPQAGMTPDQVKVLVTSENGREDPRFQNANGNGTVDTGLMQVNTPTSDTAEQQRLMDPDYNVQKGTQIFQQRVAHLGDPVLAAASYNLGAGGAVLNPMAALERAQTIYKNAGLPLPETPFTKDPVGFVNKNMDKYKSLGLFK